MSSNFLHGQTAQPATGIDKLSPDSIFEKYTVGANDTGSIGALQHIFMDPCAKTRYAEVNPKIVTLRVTGTAAPFTKRVPFQTWIDDYVKVGQYPDSDLKYDVDYRYDGMVTEFLQVYKDGEWQRTIIIHRLQGSIITVWDSSLN